VNGIGRQMDEETRRRILAKDSRARLVFGVLALVVPLLLVLLFARQERRLRALADHGAAASATLTMVSQRGSESYADYRYEVDGVAYTWNVGRKDAPFAPGVTFAISYLPEDPSLSRVGGYTRERFDAEQNLPIQRGFPIGLFVFFGAAAALCHRSVVRLRAGAPLRTKPWLSPEAAGRIVAGLLLACVLGVNFDAKVRAVQAAAFGSAPLGLPVVIVVSVAEIILFAPYFWVFSHLMRIVIESGSFSKLGIILAVARASPARRRSQLIAIGGFVYFVVLMAAWIAYAASRGI
jgi:hypothetical protein